jgi:hypothetical protein
MKSDEKIDGLVCEAFGRAEPVLALYVVDIAATLKGIRSFDVLAGRVEL